MLKEILKRIDLKPFDLRRVLWYLLYLFLTLVLQTMALTHLRPLGVCPFILPAAVVAVGMFEGANRGALFALAMGLCADMFYIESTIGFTLLFPALAFGSGFISQFFINRRFTGYMLVAAGALLVTGFMQMLRVQVSEGLAPAMIATVLLQALWALPFAALLYFPPARWIE